MVGLPSKSGGDADMPAFTLRARTGCEQSQQEHPLFDHLVGEREQIVGDFDAKRLGRPEIDYQLELGGLCNRQFGGHCPRRRIFADYRAADLGRYQVCGTRTAQNRSTAPATALATVALRAGDESTCSSARLTIIPASKSTAGIRDSYSTARLSEAS
jgi:hypothetical protein